ncbi:MAG: hypothetical protein IIY81_12150 [Lachnospiraceae bacterium]|jgi:uncharacterized protein YjdB|nr:hypothetical protein [Lachnospiraceae bacterium]
MKKRLLVCTLIFCTFCTLFSPSIFGEQTKSVAYAAEKKIKFNKKEVDIVKRQQFTLKITGCRKTDDVVFETKDSDTVSIQSTTKRSCKIRGNVVGNTKILAHVYRNTRKISTLKCNVSVTPPAVSVRFRTSSITLDVNNSINLMAFLNLKPKNTAEKPYFSCSDHSVVRIRPNGRITALKEGNATITASILNQKFDTILIRVVD